MATTKTKAGRKSARKAASTANDSKQQSSLERGGSLAQRNTTESATDPKADAPTEITSAAPPNVPALDEKGRASSPSFDEKPVTGKGDTGGQAAPEGQEVKAGEGQAPEHQGAEGVQTLEDLPAGTTVEFRAGGEVVIHAAIAGGSRKTFHGSSAKIALAAYNKFVTIGPDILPGAGPAITQENLDKAAEEAHQRSLEDLKARGKEAD